MFDLFDPGLLAVKQGLIVGASAAHLALMSARAIVALDPLVEVALQFREFAVDFFAEDDLIKFLEDGLVEAFANAVGLG